MSRSDAYLYCRVTVVTAVSEVVDGPLVGDPWTISLRFYYERATTATGGCTADGALDVGPEA